MALIIALSAGLGDGLDGLNGLNDGLENGFNNGHVLFAFGSLYESNNKP